MRVRQLFPKALGAWFVSALVALPGATPASPTSASSDTAPAVTVIHHVDMRAAALLMSGQRGGGIDGVLTVSVPEVADGALRVGFWIELGRSTAVATGGSDWWTLEVFVYALDEELEVDAFEGRRLRLDLDTAGKRQSGVRLHGSVVVSPAVRKLRVLARDQENGQFYLDEGTVPHVSEGAGDAEAFIVFPDTGEGWTEIGSDAWGFDSTHAAGFEIGGVRYVPRGRPVIAAPSELEFFVVATLPEAKSSTIDGSLWNNRGTAVGAGDFEVVNRLSTATEELLAHAVTWRVPNLDPGRYLLELSLSGESGEPIVAEISVIAVPPSMATEHPTWVTFADAPSRPVMPRTSAAELTYLDALGLCASGRWNECVTDVFELEGQAIRDTGGAKPPAGLFTLEGGGIRALTEHTPSSMIPLLALHHDVFRAWIAANDPVGQRHSVRLIAAMANDIRKRPALAPASSTAVGGGALGFTVAQAIRFGVARGVFSNESGLGTGGIAAAAAQTKEPVRQALISMTQTFIDTIVVCTFTGIAIISSGAWTSGLNGANMTQLAFRTGLPGELGGYIVAVSLSFFAFSTMLGWSYYGERNLEYLRTRVLRFDHHNGHRRRLPSPSPFSRGWTKQQVLSATPYTGRMPHTKTQ